MKKMRLVLVMVLAMALAVPMAAFAATDLVVKGDTTVRTAFGENGDGDYQLQGNWRVRVYLDAHAESGNVKAYARYRVRSTAFVPLASTGDLPLDGDLRDVYVESNGVLIPGLPEMTLRVGNWEAARINDWVGHFSRQNAVQLSGIELGPATLGLYNGWRGNAGNTVSAIFGDVNVDMVALKGIFVTHNNRPADTKSNDYAIGANLTPADGVKLAADFARHGANEANAWKVVGELATVPNMKLRASVWNTEDDFRPQFKHPLKVEHLAKDRFWVDGNDRPGSVWGDPWIAEGFSIGAETTQAGLPFEVSFKSGTITKNLPKNRITTGNVEIGGSGDVTLDPTDPAHAAKYFTPFEGKKMNVIGVGTTLAAVKLNVNVTNIEDLDPVTDVIATHTWRNTPLGGDVSLRGTVRLRKDVDTEFGADATWKAPNGFTLGLHYANYDRYLDWNDNYSHENIGEGVNIGKPGEADGFAVTAGYEFNF